MRHQGQMTNILIVDDDPLQASLMMSVLGRHFGNVHRVTDAAEALCLIEQPEFADQARLSHHRAPHAGNRRASIRGRIAHRGSRTCRCWFLARAARHPPTIKTIALSSCPGPSAATRCWRLRASSSPNTRTPSPNQQTQSMLQSTWLGRFTSCEPTHTQNSYQGWRTSSSVGWAHGPHLHATIIVEHSWPRLAVFVFLSL